MLSFSTFPLPVSMSHSHRHAVFLNVSVLCSYTSELLFVHTNRGAFWVIFAPFRMLNQTTSQWWLHRLNSTQNLSFAVVFGISSVCNGLTWQLDFTEAQKNHSMPPVSRALKMHYVLRFHVSLITKVRPFLLLNESCRLMHCFLAVPKGRLYEFCKRCSQCCFSVYRRKKDRWIGCVCEYTRKHTYIYIYIYIHIYIYIYIYIYI